MTASPTSFIIKHQLQANDLASSHANIHNNSAVVTDLYRNLKKNTEMVLLETKLGMLKGVSCKNDDATYYSFKGIPYAKPPLGDLRFKAPEPPTPWNGIRDASQHGPVCPQYNERLDRLETGSEDCLYLNVFSKRLTPLKPVPVMVWIHGGAFYTGSGNSDFYGPEFFMTHDVILVTFNYRLEVLGFLCLDSEEVPGNAGLKDQVAALKWVKSNIGSFGGDPDNITLFGCSAGSVSVSYHLLSKMSEGLFNKAICQSGVCLNEWSHNLYAKERAFQLGKLLGVDTKDVNELHNFLKKAPVELLVNVKLPALEYENIDIVDSIAFGPVIENQNLANEKFISESPIDLIKKGFAAKLPIIIGYTSAEGIEIARNLPYTASHVARIGAVVPRELKLKLSKEKLQTIDEQIRTHYFGDKAIDKSMYQEVTNLETYRLFANNIVRFAQYHLEHTSQPVYLYKFNIESERNFTKKQYKMECVRGVCHADDLPYLFNVTNIDIPLTAESRRIIKEIVKLWFNFASVSNPTPSDKTKWEPFTLKDRQCFLIDKDFSLVTRVDEEDIVFWEEIYKEANSNNGQ